MQSSSALSFSKCSERSFSTREAASFVKIAMQSSASGMLLEARIMRIQYS